MSEVVYVACADQREITVFDLIDDGSLRPRSSVAVPGIDGPSPISVPLARSADGRFLHAGLRLPPYPVCTYAVDAVGDLSFIGSALLPASMNYLAVDATGGHLLATSLPDGVVATMPIGVDGVVRSPPTQVLDQLSKPHCVVFGPNGRFAYVTLLGDDVVVRYAYDAATGTLGDPEPLHLPAGIAPRHLCVAPDASVLYLVGEADARVVALSIEAATGNLRLKQVIRTLAAAPETLAADIHVTPDGRFVVMSERVGNRLHCLRVGPGGLLVGAGSTLTEDWTRSFAFAADGAMLIAAGQHSNHVTVFAFDRHDGRLTPISRTATSGNPSWVEVGSCRCSA